MKTFLFASFLGFSTFLACGEEEKETRTEPEGANPGECTDGADNDFDGDYDCNDSDCAGSPDCLESDCDDGADNDQDGDFDCDDPDCADAPECATEDDCTDGADNDADGLFDCDDPDCAEDTACVDDFEGDEAGECTDGIDNDSDGLIDCDDPDCANSPDCEVEGDEAGECTDGIDNDSDGNIDCDDPNCEGSTDCPIENECWSLEFDGENDFIEISDNDQHDITTAITVSAWINVNTLSTERDQFIVAKGWDNDNYSWGLAIDPVNPVVEWVLFNGSSNPHATSITSIEIGVWYHLVGTYNGSEMKLYINGELEATTSTSIQIGNQQSGVIIGKWPYQPYYFNGIISDVAIWNQYLTINEIQEIYAGDYNQNQPVSYWTMSESIGNTIADSIASSDGLINGATWVEACPEQ